MQRPTTLSLSAIQDQRDPLEDHPLFTPDLEYFTPSTLISLDNTNCYYPRTLTPYNVIRHTILPLFPPSPLFTSLINSTNSLTINDIQPRLLLCNVPTSALSQLQLFHRTPDVYQSPFELIESNLEMINNRTDSFMISIYRQLLCDLSTKWHIDMSLLDYNLARLRHCAKKCLESLQQQERQEQLKLIPDLPTTATFSIEEIPLALEFYLQMDVDLFYFKTCSFRQAKPIEENMFCSKLPEIHYSLTACNQSNCTCCHPLHSRIYPGQREAVQFNVKEKYEFVNGYQAILNCPATCDTANIVYVLTCPCQQFEYVDATTMSFRDCLTKHRAESNRILQEFLFGSTITNHLVQGIKSEETRRNDGLWLYQHTARCPQAIQLFLDAHPEYWCFVPMSNAEGILRKNTMKSPSSPTSVSPSGSVRIEAYAKYLADNIADPPESYIFTERQKYNQRRFFREGKDQDILSRTETNVDLYNATIVAVLPENCSEMLRQLILSLFITHANCNLNKTGQLVNEPIYRPHPIRGQWCANLIRRSSSPS